VNISSIEQNIRIVETISNQERSHSGTGDKGDRHLRDSVKNWKMMTNPANHYTHGAKVIFSLTSLDAVFQQKILPTTGPSNTPASTLVYAAIICKPCSHECHANGMLMAGQ